jgi:hypothetical protein
MLEPRIAALLSSLVIGCACMGCDTASKYLKIPNDMGDSASKYLKSYNATGPFRWMGVGQDLVGSWKNGNPDGRPDGVFRLSLDLTPRQTITSILVYSSDANGNPAGGQFWHSSDNRRWILGVVFSGRQLNHTHVPSLGQFEGPVTLDLYCNDSGYFRTGQWFTVEVSLESGSRRNSVRL